MKKRIITCVVGLFAMSAFADLPQWLQESEFNWTMRTLVFSTARDNNQIFWPNDPALYSRRSEVAFRPDLNWKSEWLRLSVKPRAEWYEEKAHPGDWNPSHRSDSDVFIYEWKAALNLSDELHVSYGRENKQWGPSLLLSPSNPFQSDNGRTSPKTEVPSLDYAQIDWFPSFAWQVSLIANTGPGLKSDSFNNFEEVVALKVDWTGEAKQLSLVGSVRDGQERIGGYALWNVNDAWMLYGETGWQQHDFEALGGTTYTFGHGGMLSFEYFYNGNGNKTGHPLLGALKTRIDFSREMLQRRHYLLLQYTQPMLFETVDATLRWVVNVDDGSQAAFAFVDWAVHDRVELFLNASVFDGSRSSELGFALNHALQAGLEISF